MSISDVLRGKGHEVVKVRTTDTVQAAVRKLASSKNVERKLLYQNAKRMYRL